MNITEDVQDDISRMHLNGRFDADTCEKVEGFIKDRIGDGIRHFVINMEDVPFIASAGLRVIILTAKKLRQKYKGDLRVAGLQENVFRVFEISGLDNVLGIFDDTEAAVRSFADEK
jgi:anti-anti-sigma factor